jgi:hypothetical protein
MKTYTVETLPAHARYLGSENGDGSMYESLLIDIERAIEPARIREPDGTFSYFEIAREMTR